MQTNTGIINERQTYFSLQHILPFIILFEGFVSIAVEILTIRQLLPVAGGSVIVTSLIIGVFLLFLALGYQHGGRLKQNPQNVLRKNFMIASLWIAIGLSYLFIDIFFYLLQFITGPHVVYPLIAYLLLITAPLIFILGQTVPMTMNMIKQDASAGKIGGNILGLSTLGSFLGAVITTLVFMQIYGVAWTVFFVVCCLLILALILLDPNVKFYIQLRNVLGILIVAYLANIAIEHKYFVLSDNYANYQILNSANSKLKQDEKVLIINDAFSSFIDANNHGFKYIEAIKKIIFNDLNLHNAEILVLGAGGFSISAEKLQDNHFTYIDIDAKIKKVIYPKFLDKMNSTFISDDARHYLLASSKKYAVIVSDAYTDIKSIPANLITKEYMLAIKKRLTDNGVAIFNIIANPSLRDPYSKGIDNTIRSAFPNCMAMPVVYSDRPTNIIYACRNNIKLDTHLYTDNLNRSTTDSFAW